MEFRGAVALDTETTGLERTARLISVQAHDGVTTVVLDARRVTPAALLRRLLGKKWIFQNGKFDFWHLLPYLDELTCGQPWKAWDGLWDTYLAEAVLTNGHNDLKRDLASQALRHCRIKLDKGEQKAFVQRKGEPDEEYAVRIEQPFTESQLDYMVGDVKLLHSIMRSQHSMLERHNMMPVAQLEFDLMPVLADMERNGMRIDVPGTEAMLKELLAEQEALGMGLAEQLTPYILEWRAARHQASEEQIARHDNLASLVKAEIELKHSQIEYPDQKSRRAAINAAMKEWRLANARPSRVKMDEGPINLNSNQQMPVAFEAMGLKLKNFQADTLEYVRDQMEDPILQKLITDLLEYKKLHKLTSTTLEPMLELRDEDDRVHTVFGQIVRTGRMSSSDPNMQNIPARGERGKRIRHLYIADPGCVIISADYSQIELRVLAEAIYRTTGDRTMLNIFLDGKLDVHTKTASEMYGVPYDQVGDGDLRKDAKVINFGLVYGMTEYGLARDLKCSKQEALAKRAAYFRYHKGVPGWMRAVQEEALSRGYATTMIGRRRYFPQPPDDFESEWEEKSYWDGLRRQAMNTPIQGTAADLMKIALVSNWKSIRDIARQENVVHDELVEEAAADLAEEVGMLTQQAMTEAASTILKHCPVKVDVAIGESWS